MKILGSKCGGCCTAPCNDCCTTDAPSTFEVTVDLTDEDCGVCDSYLSGTYVLTRTSPSSCIWDFYEGSGTGVVLEWCDPGCTDPDDCYYIYYRQVRLVIVRRAGVCYLELQVFIIAHHIPLDGTCTSQHFIENTWFFYAVLGEDADCTNLTDVDIPWNNTVCKCFGAIVDCDPVRWICEETTATASITAV